MGRLKKIVEEIIDGVETPVEVEIEETPTVKPDGYVVIDGSVVPDPTKTGVFSN